jgi:hypothetical protein
MTLNLHKFSKYNSQKLYISLYDRHTYIGKSLKIKKDERFKIYIDRKKGTIALIKSSNSDGRKAKKYKGKDFLMLPMGSIPTGLPRGRYMLDDEGVVDGEKYMLFRYDKKGKK